MAPRLKLQLLLRDLLGSNNVYFQPPPNLSMLYPCIVYTRDLSENQFADNFPYMHTKRYQVTYISRDPETDVPDKVELLPLCRVSRFFTADNLHHYVYTLFF